MNECYDLDRTFKMCPKNQSIKKYAEQINAVHAQDKTALIIFGYDHDNCSWCSRIVTMYYTTSTWANVKNQTILVPISSRVFLRAENGMPVIARSLVARDFLSSIGVKNPGDEGVPQLFLVKPNGTIALSLQGEMEHMELNYKYLRADEAGAVMLSSKTGKPFPRSYRSYNVEELVRKLEEHL